MAIEIVTKPHLSFIRHQLFTPDFRQILVVDVAAETGATPKRFTASWDVASSPRLAVGLIRESIVRLAIDFTDKGQEVMEEIAVERAMIEAKRLEILGGDPVIMQLEDAGTKALTLGTFLDEGSFDRVLPGWDGKLSWLQVYGGYNFYRAFADKRSIVKSLQIMALVNISHEVARLHSLSSTVYLPDHELTIHRALHSLLQEEFPL